MATNSQGITIHLGPGADVIGEVVSISIDSNQADFVEVTPRSNLLKSKVFSSSDTQEGSITLTFLSQWAGLLAIGESIDFTIKRNGFEIFTFPGAMLESLSWQASVGQLQQYTAVFRAQGYVD